MIVLFSSIIILLSSFIKDSKLIIALFVLVIAIVFILQNYNTSLKTIYNPVFALNIKDNILGYFEVVYTNEATPNIELIAGKGVKPYICYLLVGSIIWMFSLVQDFYFDGSSKKRKKFSSGKLFRFEFEKIIWNSEFLIYSIGIILISVIMFISFHNKDKDSYNNSVVNEQMGAHLSGFYISAKEELDNFVLTKQNYKTKAEKEEYQNKYNLLFEEVNKTKNYTDLMNKKLEAFKSGNGTLYYSITKKEMNLTIDALGANTKSVSYTNSTLYESRALYDYLSKENINPILNDSVVFPSEYEDVDNFVNAIKNKDEYHYLSHSATHTVFRSIRSYYIHYITMVIALFSCFSGYSIEKENGNQIDLLYTQPISRLRYHINKFVAAISAAMILIVLSNAVLFIMGLLTDGLGEYNFGVINYDKLLNPDSITYSNNDYFSIISIWKYLIKYFIVLLMQMGFIASISLLISLYFNERINVFGISIVVIGVFMFISNKLPSDINLYSPFNHLATHNIANEAIRIHNNITNYTYMSSIYVLGISTCFILIVGAYISKIRTL